MQSELRYLVSFLAAVCCLVFVVGSSSYALTFHNPKNVPPEIGTEASSKLSLGLAQFYELLSALERKDFDKARMKRDSGVAQLNEAEELFKQVREAVSENNSSPINVRSNDDGFKALEELGRILELKGMAKPKYWEDLPEIAVATTKKLSTKLAALEIGNLSVIYRQIHDLIEESLDLQYIGLLSSRIWLAFPER